MAQSRVGRREMLLGAGAGAAGALAVFGGLGSPTLAKADDDSHNGLLGAFLITITSTGGGPPPFKAVVGFASGGLAVANDAAGPGNSYLGAWDGDADGFEVRYLQFQFDNSGTSVGWIRIDAKGTVSGDHTSGTFKLTFVPNSGPTQPVGAGTFSGNRIPV